MTIYEKLRDVYPQLSKGRKRIATYILENSKEVPFLSAAELGERASISESVVVRFATWLGYAQYGDMQKDLRHEFIKGMNIVERMTTLSTGNNNMDVLCKEILSNEIANINETCLGLDMDALNTLADEMIAAKHVGIMAIRGGLSAGTYLQVFLNQFLNHTLLLSAESYNVIETIHRWGENDIIFAFLFYKNSTYFEKVLAYAKTKKCKVVVVTDSLVNSVCEFADQILLAKIDGAVITYTAPMVLMNILLNIIMTKLQERGDDFAKQMEEFEDVLRVTLEL